MIQKPKTEMQLIKNENTSFDILQCLDNGCFIATMKYSEENAKILLPLLKSFEEQYGEIIDEEAAKEELALYDKKGILFLYLDEKKRPVSMNGCIYDYPNETVEFFSQDKTPSNLYFYGLSTIPEYRGKGACRTLIHYAIDYAQKKNIDLVYARTDLINSNSEWLMAQAGMEICTEDDTIIAEWVDVTETTGDYRLHMWKPLKEGIGLISKGNAVYADKNTRAIITPSAKVLQMKPQIAC